MIKKAASPYIWYASYGSNISEERFCCYLRGGRPAYAQRACRGCTDQSLPLRQEPIEINHPLYFARESRTWDGGAVAFIRGVVNADSKTYGRKYLITAAQFAEVVAQEMDSETVIPIDLKLVETKQSTVVKANSWYGRILYLGEHDGFPIFTFTNEQDEQALNKPEASYLKTIAKGLMETYRFGTIEIVNYLLEQDGVKGSYCFHELLDLLQNHQPSPE